MSSFQISKGRSFEFILDLKRRLFEFVSDLKRRSFDFVLDLKEGSFEFIGLVVMWDGRGLGFVMGFWWNWGKQ